MLEFRLAKQLKNKRIRFAVEEDIEPHEVFLDRLAQEREKDFGISEKRLEVPLSKRMLQVMWVLVVISVLFLLLRTFQFQVIENKKFLALAQENKFIIKSIYASRGVIYDQKGAQLVFNKPSFSLVVDKTKLPKSEEDKKNIFTEVAGVLNWNTSDLENKINNTEDGQILVSENLDLQVLIILDTKIAELPGFEIQKNSVRDYKDGEIFSHVVGYTGQIDAEELKNNKELYSPLDYVGKTGIEKYYEEVLRKSSGKIQMEKDVYGNILSKNIIALPESGENLVLWLDAELQKNIFTELKNMIDVVGAKKGAAVAINPKTGGVMALLSIPGFDNNLFNKGSDLEALQELLQDPQNPLFNRATMGQYPTGSTIKPLTASAALQEKLISPSKIINCQGGISIPHRYDPSIVYTFDDWTTHGPTDMRKAIAESCNTYFYTIGGGYKDQEGLGPSRIKKYLELFSWGNKTEIDLPGESKGFIPSPDWKKQTKKENWWDGDTYNLSIGQGDIAVTPLQVATAFVAIANGGTLLKPHIVQKIIDNDKNVIKEFSSEILRENFIDTENLKVVREGMRQAVTGEGSPQASSILLNSLPVAAAAKTGTAQTPRTNHYNNWVTVFAPYDDPQIVLTVLIEDVPNAQVAALPVARAVLNQYFSPKTNNQQQ